MKRLLRLAVQRATASRVGRRERVSYSGARSIRALRPLIGEMLEARVVLDANSVVFWNQVAMDAALADSRLDQPQQGGPTRASRAMAIVHASMYDAYNGAHRTYEPYLVQTLAPRGASANVALAQAAHDALAALYPWQGEWLDKLLDDRLADVPDGVGQDRGIAYGREVAKTILEARSEDGAAHDPPYATKVAAGSHQADPLNPEQGYLGPGWGQIKPFAVPSGDYFRAPSFPDLSSEEYAAAFREVWVKGALDAEVRDRDHDGRPDRTDEETEIGLFWGYDHRLGTPPRLYNEAARVVAQQEGASPVETLRLLTLVNLAMADAGITAWESKYHYNTWRPIVAIRQADADGNPNTWSDLRWRPLGAPANAGDPTGFPGSPGPDSNPDPVGAADFTPPFPAYTSGHATFGAAAFHMLADFFGRDDISFSLYSEDSGTQRWFGSFSQAAEENGISRIYLGIHWPQDNEVGQQQGRQIADYVFEHCLRPLPGTASTLHQSGDTLTILGSRNGNTVSIVDNGAGQMHVAADHAWSRDFYGIQRLVIQTAAGGDVVRYALQVAAPEGAAIAPANLQIDLGAGHDVFELDAQTDFPSDFSVSRAWKIQLAAGEGRDNVSAWFGDVLFDVGLSTSLGDGNDRARVGVNGAVAKNAHFAWSAEGGLGYDQIALVHRGRVDGTLTARLRGGAGNDRVEAVLNVADGSCGFLDVGLLGGEGDDLLTLLARNSRGSRYVLPASLGTRLWIDGGAGWDTARRTANVRVVNGEQ